MAALIEKINYIKRKPTGEAVIYLSNVCTKSLKSFAPKGCPFKGYSLLNLLQDLVQMYDWIIPRYAEITIEDFIERAKQKDYKAELYGDEIIYLLNNQETVIELDTNENW